MKKKKLRKLLNEANEKYDKLCEMYAELKNDYDTVLYKKDLLEMYKHDWEEEKEDLEDSVNKLTAMIDEKQHSLDYITNENDKISEFLKDMHASIAVFLNDFKY